MTMRKNLATVAVAAAVCLPVMLGSTSAFAAPGKGGPHKNAPAASAPSVTVTTDNETPVLYDDEEGGNASGDDPAIWVDPADSYNSMVIVTAKEGGLRVYDMNSVELQNLPSSDLPNAGRYNNVDIAYGLTIGGETVDVAVVSDRYNDTLRFFAIDPAGAKAATPLTEITSADYPFLFISDAAELEDEQTAYGLGIYQPTSGPDKGKTFAVTTREGNTTLAVSEIIVNADGTMTHNVVRYIEMPATFDLGNGSTWTPCDEPGALPQLEGVTIDQRTGTLYAAQELVGLWRIELEKPNKEPVLIDKVTNFGTPYSWDPAEEECVMGPDAGLGGNITPDAEGVDIYYGPGANGYVILSNQGSDVFTVYDRKGSNALVGSFMIDGVNGVDGINGSDGLAVTNRPVAGYTRGLLVSHDEPETGANVDEERDATNFSYVQWGDISDALGLKLNTKAGNDPRFK